VIDIPLTDAFTLPGGRIYVTRNSPRCPDGQKLLLLTADRTVYLLSMAAASFQASGANGGTDIRKFRLK
jgi:hypothetical protein